MKKIFKLAAMVAFVGSCLTTHAQEGGKMLKREGRTDDKMLRENKRMMHDGTVKHSESMGSEPKLIKEEDRLDHKKSRKQKMKK